MIGEFLLSVTDIEFIIAVLVYTLFMIFIAYKKPQWYKAVLIVFVCIVLFGIMYTMGWNNSLDYSNIKFPHKTPLENHFSGSPNLTFVLHFIWLDRVYRKRLEEAKPKE